VNLGFCLKPSEVEQFSISPVSLKASVSIAENVRLKRVPGGSQDTSLFDSVGDRVNED